MNTLNKKRLLVSLFAVFAVLSASAQTEDDFFSDFKSFRDSIFTDFENFRQQANAEYVAFMREAWKPFATLPAEQPPAKPKPVKPVIAEPKPEKPEDTPPIEIKPIVIEPIKPKPTEPESPQPIEPIKPEPQIEVPEVKVGFYGTPLVFHFDKLRCPRLNNAEEASVADMWEKLSEKRYDNLIGECLQYRNTLNLCDWAYVMLTQRVSETCCGKGNEAAVMHTWLLTQSGFKTRIGRAENKLSLLFASDASIYYRRFFNIEGTKYYIFDRSLEGKQFHIFNHAFPKEKSMILAMKQPKLAVKKTMPKLFMAEDFPETKVSVELNQNLIDFYNDYPVSSRWDEYSKASLSEQLKSCLYPVLRKAVKGKTKAEAADILINFVQTGFEYATDQVQFGYERPLFPDESFFYPYCDCEDRSILYSCLVRELLGLEVVLLDYPEHIATAVKFPNYSDGDYLKIGEDIYMICDPTYIGASIGMCMPNYKTVSPKVIRL